MRKWLEINSKRRLHLSLERRVKAAKYGGPEDNDKSRHEV